MAASALSQQASCKRCTLLLGGLHTRKTHQTSSLSKHYISNLHGKRKACKGLRCQTGKEERDRFIAAAQDNSPDTLLVQLHDNQGRDDEARTSLEDDYHARGSKYNAECHVEVVSWRERRITASIEIEASPQRVWEVLTDYERLSEFIPNLICSEKITCPHPGRIWLLQRGMQRMMYWNIQAHVVLDLKEFPLLETGSELHFFMVDGDFKRYDGKWYLQTGPSPQTTLLHYEVNVVPKVIFPAAFVESIIKADLPKNLCAIAKRAEAESEVDCKVSKISNKQISSKAVHDNIVEEARGIVNTSAADSHWSGFGRACKLGSNCPVDEIHFRRLDDLLENGGVHRQVVATMTVKGSLKDVWSVLTAYEALPEFVPNLANSVVLSRDGKRVRLLQEGCKCLLYMVLHARVILDLWEQPEQEISFKQVEGDFDSFEGNWTLNQFGSQHTVLKYTVDTKIWKDCILAESLVEEVIYEDIPSNLCAIRDRVESLGNHPSLLPICAPEASDSASLSGSEVPSTYAHSESTEPGDDVNNLTRLEIQETSTHKELLRDPALKMAKGHARIEGLMDDFRVLEKEIRDFITAHGTEGVMPLRKHLRQHGRSDLGKAISAMGGFRTVAARMKLMLSYEERKPVGYWDDIRNLRNEVIAAQKAIGCDPAILPSRLSIEKLGSYSLARALEKWGGAKETARILGLKTKGLQKQKHRCKETSAKDDEGLNLVNKPLLVDSATPSDLKKDEERQSIKDALKADRAQGFSPESYLRAVASFIEKASELPLSNHEASSVSTGQDPSQQTSTKVMPHSLASNKESPQTSSSDSFPSIQFKGKKRPYKTGVPQESSKWLTLFTDTEQTDVEE
eukprot:c24624_g1_i1 orf=315-2870(-)